MKNVSVRLEGHQALYVAAAMGVGVAAVICAGLAWWAAWRFDWDELRLALSLSACGYPITIALAAVFVRWNVGSHVETLRRSVDAIGRGSGRAATNIAVVPQFPNTPPQIEARATGEQWTEM